MKRIIRIARKAPWDIIAIILFWKTITIALLLCAQLLLPFNKNAFNVNFKFPQKQTISPLTSLATWDGQHYLYLAKVGYKPNQDSNCFYPLYPLTIRMVDYVIRNTFISALVVANICSFVALIFLYKFFLSQSNKDVAFYSLLLFITFPTAFYLNLIYSEGLFFLLLFGFLLSIHKNKYFIASLFAFFLPLARSVGILIELPLFLYVLKRPKEMSISIPTFKQPINVQISSSYFLLLFPLVGFLVNLGYMFFTTGNMFAEFEAQKYFIGGYYVINLLNPALLVKNLFGTPLVFHGPTNSFLDRLFFGIFIAFIPILYKKIERPLFYLYLCFILVPFFGSFMGYLRYILPAYTFIILAGGSYIVKKKTLLASIIFISIMLQTLFIILQSLNYWVS